MALTVLHTGQTGVERGVDRGARQVGLPIEGVCSAEVRDEFGSLPSDLRRDLTPCRLRGVRNALRETLERCDALVLAVPDTQRVLENTGVDALRRAARTSGRPIWVVDPASNRDHVYSALRQLEARAPLRLMITGPRQTRWADGERFGWRFISELAMHEPVVEARKHRVLVVDDHPDEAEAACDFVQALGHICVAATNGRDAIHVAKELDPDVVLLDIRMPDVDGYEVARHFRQHQRRPLFLAAITGWEPALDRSEALAAGFDRLLVKPATGPAIRQLLGEATEALSA